jgi:hypothetical protein
VSGHWQKRERYFSCAVRSLSAWSWTKKGCYALLAWKHLQLRSALMAMATMEEVEETTAV